MLTDDNTEAIRVISDRIVGIHEEISNFKLLFDEIKYLKESRIF